MTHSNTSIGVIARQMRALLLPVLTVAALTSLAARPGHAQPVSVTGRVSMIEKSSDAPNDLGNTVIYLISLDSASPALPTVAATIAMNGRAFVPRLQVVTPGSRVAFPNQDPFSHNIFSTTPGAAFDLGLYPLGKSKETRFRRTGAFPIYCNIHPRMTAFVVVAPTPWYTQAGNDGRWSLEGVPAGRYSLHVWHERAPESKAEIRIPAAGLTGLATQLDARGFRFAQHMNKFGKQYDKTGKDRY